MKKKQTSLYLSLSRYLSLYMFICIQIVEHGLAMDILYMLLS